MLSAEFLKLFSRIKRLRDKICDLRGRFLLQGKRYKLVFLPLTAVVQAVVPDDGKRCRHIQAIPEIFQKRILFAAVVEQTDQLQCAVLCACALLQQIVDSRQSPACKDGL